MNGRRLCAVGAALALGVAACGDDDDDETAPTGTGTGTEEEQPASPAEESASATVTLTETEFAIDPGDVKVEKAGVVEIRVQNAGSVPHALEVESEDFEEETEDIAPGESATLKVELAEGTYQLYCPIGDHEAQGMTGELVVGGAASGGADPGDDNPSGDDSGGVAAPTDDAPGY